MSDELLSASGEAAWQALRQHIEWTQGFWSGWVFTDYTPSVHELHRRVEALLRGVGRKTVLRQPREPGELVDVLLWLNAGADGCDGCVIVAVVSSAEPWMNAWDQLVLRLNERRELLRTKIQCGLLMFAPTSFKVRTREAAPDLWSIRSLALDVAPVIGVTSESRPMAFIEPERLETSAGEVALALQAVAAAQSAGQVDAEVDARIRASKALFTHGRRHEGREQAARAVERATSRRAAAVALVTLADIENELGDLVSAERHYRAAIDADGEGVDVWAYLYLSDLLLNQHRLDEARVAVDAALVKSKEQGARAATTAEALRNDGAILQRIGLIEQTKGDWTGAASAFEMMLNIGRRRRSMVGDIPGALRDEAIALMLVANARRAQGDLSVAAGLYESSLGLIQRVRRIVGAQEWVLRDEILSREALGDVKRAQGDLLGALPMFQTALDLCRRRRMLVGDTVVALKDEATGLERWGDLMREFLDFDAAERAFRESLEIRRRLRDVFGATAEALRDESISLERVGDVQWARGDLAGAGLTYSASLALCRRVRGMVGDTIEALEDLAYKLRRCARSEWHLGRFNEAHAALAEAEGLWREVQSRCGRLPRNISGLKGVLDDLNALKEDGARLVGPT